MIVLIPIFLVVLLPTYQTYDVEEVSSISDLVGHLQPLGYQRPPDVVTEELHSVPHPREFWEKYVHPKKPVLFRGAAKKSRAYELWTEDFLITKYGNLTVRLEARAEDNTRIPAGYHGILGRDTIGHFMRNYQTVDSYLISQIPIAMEMDISIPPCLRCGTFAESIQEVHLFLSAHGGKTVVHKDPYSNIHCVFNGTKEWILIDPRQTDLLYMSEYSQDEWGGYSIVDVDAVDLKRFPKISDIHYSKVTINKGDCIFMPGSYWHQVRSHGYMNSAVSIWFSQVKSFEETGCAETRVDFTPMNELYVLWRNPGNGNDFTQGHIDIHVLRRLLLVSVDNDGRISLQHFTEHFFKSDEEDEMLRKDAMERVQKFKTYVDPAGIGYITTEQVGHFTLDELKAILLFVDPTDVSNTKEFEYSHISADEIETLLYESQSKGGYFEKDVFIERYVEDLGGTINKANEIIANLQVAEELVDIETVLKRVPKALHKYYNAMRHDPSFERKMYQHLNLHDEL